MADLLTDWLHKKPETRQQIAAWTKTFLGFKVHDSCRCRPKNDAEAAEWKADGRKQHQSQLDYLESAFFNQHSASVYMASRNGGKSQCAGVVSILDCWFKPGIKIAVAPYTRDQAEYIKAYTQKLLTHLETVTKAKIADVRKNDITFKNGSTIRFFSGGKSDANVTGYRPNVLFIDEADKFSQRDFDGLANCLEAGGEITSRLDILSTNYTLEGDGVILKQIERYEKFNDTKPEHLLPMKVFRCCLLDILEKCDDRYKCFDETTKTHCQLWQYCKGRAKEGSGYYRIEEAIAKTLNNSRQGFEAEFMLLRPTSEHTYFPNFSTAEHVCDSEFPLDPRHLTLINFDFGAGRCPHAALVVQKLPSPLDPATKKPAKGDPGTYLVIDEFLEEGQLESLIARIQAKYPIILDADCFYDPKGNERPHIQAAKSYADVLRKAGFFPRCKQLKRKETFIQLLALISPASGPPRLKINKRCKNLIHQIQAAEHKTKGSQILDEPADGKGDDLLDCLRYIVGWTWGTYAKHNGARRLVWF